VPGTVETVPEVVTVTVEVAPFLSTALNPGSENSLQFSKVSVELPVRVMKGPGPVLVAVEVPVLKLMTIEVEAVLVPEVEVMTRVFELDAFSPTVALQLPLPFAVAEVVLAPPVMLMVELAAAWPKRVMGEVLVAYGLVGGYVTVGAVMASAGKANEDNERRSAADATKAANFPGFNLVMLIIFE
jgi:hypothetical protein